MPASDSTPKRSNTGSRISPATPNRSKVRSEVNIPLRMPTRDQAKNTEALMASRQPQNIPNGSLPVSMPNHLDRARADGAGAAMVRGGSAGNKFSFKG